MPCCDSFSNHECPEEDIHLRFAVLPMTDMDGDAFWLRRYWEYCGKCELGFFAMRGLKKYYKDKNSFWMGIQVRVANLCTSLC